MAISGKMAAQLIRMSVEGHNQFKFVLFILSENYLNYSFIMPYMVIFVALLSGLGNVHFMNMGLQNSQVKLLVTVWTAGSILFLSDDFLKNLMLNRCLHCYLAISA